jgi:CheY-like chemotaxis protein
MRNRDFTSLIAEDDPIVRNMIWAIIQQEGYSFLVAADRREALTLSRAYPDEIHLLLTDVRMPKMNGLDLASEIIKQRPSIRILVMSGEASRTTIDSITYFHAIWSVTKFAQHPHITVPCRSAAFGRCVLKLRLRLNQRFQQP